MYNIFIDVIASVIYIYILNIKSGGNIMRVIKKSIAAMLCAAMVITLAPAGSADAAKKPSLKKKASVAVGQTVKIKVKNAKKSSKFTWKTSNKKIAKISKKVAKGKKASATVKGVKEGKAKITATYKKGSKKVKLTCKVTVNKAPVVTSQPTSTAPAAQPTQPGGGPDPGTNQTPEPTQDTPKITNTPKPSPTPTNVPKNGAVEARKVAEGTVITADGKVGANEWMDADKVTNLLKNPQSVRGEVAIKNATAKLMWSEDALYALVESDAAMDEVKVFADVDGDATNANAVSATGVLSADKKVAEVKVPCTISEEKGLKAEIQITAGGTINYFDSVYAMVYDEAKNEFALKDEGIKAGKDDSVLGEVNLFASLEQPKEAFYTTDGAAILAAAAISENWEAEGVEGAELQKSKTMKYVDSKYWTDVYAANGDKPSIFFTKVNTTAYNPNGDNDLTKIQLASQNEDGTWSSDRDKAQGYVIWDDDYLYVLFDVNDTDISPANEDHYTTDSTEFFFNEDPSDPTYGAAGESSAVQLRVDAISNVFSSNDSSTGKYSLVAHAVGYKYADGVKETYGEGCTGYQVEYIIKLNNKHTAGEIMGMDLQINDCYTETVMQDVTDDAGNTQQQEVQRANRACTITAYDTENRNFEDPTAFGRVKLVNKDAADDPTPPAGDDIVVPLSNHAIAGWIQDATAVDNADGSVTINYAKDGRFRGCAFKLDAPVDLSGYSKVVVDAEPSIADYDLCISVLDATKKDKWNAEFAQGIKYGASFPGELALADIKAGETEDSEGNMVIGGDYSNIIGVSIFNGGSGKEQSVTIKSIKFVK